MKKLNLLIAGAALAFFMSSCVVSQQHVVTGNPIGTKVGVAKENGKDKDYSLQTAAKNGGITKIGSVDVTVRSFLGFKYKTVVTGE